MALNQEEPSGLGSGSSLPYILLLKEVRQASSFENLNQEYCLDHLQSPKQVSIPIDY